MTKPATDLPYGFTTGNAIELIRGGKPYFDLLLQLINAAQKTIHLQVYIFDDDETGHIIARALMQAAKRKVQVYVLADGYASQVMGKKLIQQLREAGVYFRFFEPIFKNRYFYFGRRLHHKVFVADAAVALVGGINITNRYNDMPQQQAWLDFALLVRGAAAGILCARCRLAWNGWAIRKQKDIVCENDAPVNAGNSPVRICTNDWVRHRNEISGTYIQMLRTARKEVTIFCSYFLPGRFMRRLLRSASKRGIRIRVVTAGPTDVPLSKRAERWLYDWLLRYNVELYEYQPSVLHAKIAVCDGEWLTVGSYNINNISAYASIELNADVYDAAFATSVQQQLDAIIKQYCQPVTMASHRKTKNIFNQFIRWASYEIIRLIFFSVTFYYRQQRGNRFY